MNLAAGAFPKPQVLPARWAPADHPPPREGGGLGAHPDRPQASPPLSEPFTFPNRRSIETWLKISLNAKLSLKPLVSAPLETGHHVKIEILNQLDFLSFIQLCCEVQSPSAKKK